MLKYSILFCFFISIPLLADVANFPARFKVGNCLRLNDNSIPYIIKVESIDEMNQNYRGEIFIRNQTLYGYMSRREELETVLSYSDQAKYQVISCSKLKTL